MLEHKNQSMQNYVAVGLTFVPKPIYLYLQIYIFCLFIFNDDIG